jgi:putative Holliday junction resolvase
MRILALDVGKRRIGIAISDPLALTARPHSTIERNKESVGKIEKIISEMNVDLLLIGLPLHLSGVEGEQAKDVRKFAAQLAAVNIPIEFVDERLSTVDAQERLGNKQHQRGQKEKGKLDAVAAAIILEAYLKSR